MLIAIAVALWSGAAQPAPPAPALAPKPKKVLQLLEPPEVDAERLLPPPPAEDSERGKAELEALRRIALSVTPSRMEQARWDDEHEDPSMLAPVLGADFDMTRLAATRALLAIVQADASYSATAAKKVFQRKRPWAVDGSIKTCDPNDKPLTSYPSGHATLGYSLSLTMAAVLPGKAQALLARADDYAYSRQVCGSHFASDTQASQALATAMVTALMARPEFQGKLAAARAELMAKGWTEPGR